MPHPDTRKSLALSLLAFGILFFVFSIRRYFQPAPSAPAPNKLPILQKKWEIDLNDVVEGGLALSEEGTIIAASKQGYVFAIDPDGTLQWKTFIGATTASPTVGRDGAIYLSNNNGRVIAINSTGSVRWRTTVYDGNTLDRTCAALGRDVLYSAAGRGLFALNLSNGSVVWTATYVPGQRGAVTLLPGGTLVYPGRGRLWAIHNDGHLVWMYPPYPVEGVTISGVSAPSGPFDVSSGIAPGPDRQLIMASGKGLAALAFGGTLAWEFAAPSYSSNFATPVIASDGTIYFGDSGGTLHALLSYGGEKWSVKPGVSIAATPVLGADGTIFLVDGASLVAISPEGNTLAQVSLDSGVTSSPTLAPDGTLYVVTSSGKLSAFAGGHGGLMDSSWPKYQGDGVNSGEARRF